MRLVAPPGRHEEAPLSAGERGFLGETGLAHAGLARDDHQPPGPLRDRLHCRQQRGMFRLPPDKFALRQSAEEAANWGGAGDRAGVADSAVGCAACCGPTL